MISISSCVRTAIDYSSCWLLAARMTLHSSSSCLNYFLNLPARLPACFWVSNGITFINISFSRVHYSFLFWLDKFRIQNSNFASRKENTQRLKLSPSSRYALAHTQIAMCIETELNSKVKVLNFHSDQAFCIMRRVLHFLTGKSIACLVCRLI